MGKIINRVRDRERQKVSRLIVEAERERLMRLAEANTPGLFWRLVDRLRKRRR